MKPVAAPEDGRTPARPRPPRHYRQLRSSGLPRRGRVLLDPVQITGVGVGGRRSETGDAFPSDRPVLDVAIVPGLTFGVAVGKGKGAGAAVIVTRQVIPTGGLSHGDKEETVIDGITVFIQKHPSVRSEERRVGKECRSRWSPYH